MIGGVGIQSLLQRMCRQSQRLAARCYLDGFEIQILDRLPAYQFFDFLDDVALDFPLEFFFAAPASSSSSEDDAAVKSIRASAQSWLASQ